MSRLHHALVILLTFAAHASAADTPDVAPAKQAFDSGDYKQCLVAINAVFKEVPTRYKPDGGQPDIRSTLYQLRGECHLKLGNRPDAMEAFKSAFTFATTEEQRLAAGPILWLTQASPKLVYPPTGEAPIDITDPAKRTDALKALYDDRLKGLQRDIDAAAKASSPSRAKELLPKFTELLLLEKSTGGNTGRSLAASQPVGERFAAIVAKECETARTRVEGYRRIASMQVDNEYTEGLTIYRFKTQRGLDSRQKEEMNALVNALQDVKKFVQAWHELNPDANAADPWSGSVKPIDDAIADAKSVLDRQWHRRRP